ncbi:MAG TPA: long-chain fatty acid--CoA ligase [Deltaproteobacteria bacterium]|nr:long-chain fatty acid--CoA ligase [Deltaproteobacteria bacterium]
MSTYQETSMAAVFQNRVQELGGKACVMYRNQNNEYEEISWNKMNDMVRKMSLYLISRGIGHGDKVALFSPNRYEWWVADLAILSIGAVNVPIYATNTPEEVRYIIEDSDSRLCFAGTEEHMNKVLKVMGKLPILEGVILFDEPGQVPPGVVTFQSILKDESIAVAPEEFDKRINAIKPEDLATLIYTSGTTGNPKGVMLSHKNILTNVQQFVDGVPKILEEHQIVTSFLPLSHAFERAVTYYCDVYAGNTVAFVRSLETVLEDFTAVRPTMIATVPRLLEKIHAGILQKVSLASPVKKALFNWAVNTGKKNVPYICNGKPRTGLFALRYNLADRLIFSKLKAALGFDRLFLIGCGGAPLAVHDAEFFLGMGINVLEGFGLSETSPVTHFNIPGHIRLGTVGRPLRDTIAKIGDDGELLIKGPQVMMGYYKNEAATKEVLTEDGFLKTGDIAEIDKEGNLKITGRIKDLIITSGGKNVSPQNLENSLKASDFIEQVAIIGDNRSYLTSLIVPAFEILEPWAKENGIAFSSRDELLRHEKVKSLFDEEIEKYMAGFARVEQIKKYTLMSQPWTQDTGELTPTLKVKRRIIINKFADVIDKMYAE